MLEQSIGLYKTGNFLQNNPTATVSTSEEIQKLHEKFDPKRLQVAPNVYDFTKAYGYDEDLTRYNLNKVNRPDMTTVIAPSLKKEVKVKEIKDYVKKNKKNMIEVSHINVKAVKKMRDTEQSVKKRII